MSASPSLQSLQITYPGQAFLGVKEIAQALGQTPASIRSRHCRGELPFRLCALGGRNVISVVELAAVIESGGKLKGNGQPRKKQPPATVAAPLATLKSSTHTN